MRMAVPVAGACRAAERGRQATGGDAKGARPRMRAGAGRAGGDYLCMAVPVAGGVQGGGVEAAGNRRGGERVPGMRKAPGRRMRAGAGRAGGDYLWMAVPDLPSRASAALCRSAMMARPPDWAKAMAA